MKMIKKQEDAKAEKFRVKGSKILKDQSFGIGTFLKDLYPKSGNAQIHKTTIPQKATTTARLIQDNTVDQSANMKKEALGRLHLQIRQDLMEKLLEVVFKRKRNPKYKGRDATQRSVIEEALECYFKDKFS